MVKGKDKRRSGAKMNTIVENIEHELNLAILDIRTHRHDTDPTAQNIVHSAKDKLREFLRASNGHDCELETNTPDAFCETCAINYEIREVLK